MSDLYKKLSVFLAVAGLLGGNVYAADVNESEGTVQEEPANEELEDDDFSVSENEESDELEGSTDSLSKSLKILGGVGAFAKLATSLEGVCVHGGPKGDTKGKKALQYLNQIGLSEFHAATDAVRVVKKALGMGGKNLHAPRAMGLVGSKDATASQVPNKQSPGSAQILAGA